MFCGKCGKQIADGAKFCPYCGAAQEASGRPAPMPDNGSGPAQEKSPAAAPGGAVSAQSKRKYLVAILAVAAVVLVVVLLVRSRSMEAMLPGEWADVNDEETVSLILDKDGTGTIPSGYMGDVNLTWSVSNKKDLKINALFVSMNLEDVRFSRKNGHRCMYFTYDGDEYCYVKVG